MGFLFVIALVHISFCGFPSLYCYERYMTHTPLF